jgi:xylulokinase
MNTYLSIDVGTSSTKLSLFGQNGQFIASRSASYSVDYPHPDWAEQDPEEWWRAVRRLGPEIMQAQVDNHLKGISISGQAPLCVPVDAGGSPLRNAILWLDRRSTNQVEWLLNKIGEERARRISSNRLDSYFGGAKWLWFQQEEPALFARTWKILQANGYVVMKLTGSGAQPGQAVIDPAQAGLCSPCFNSALADWDSAICAEMGIPLNLLPEVHRPEEIIGAISASAALETGLPEGTPVVCGGGDFACACLGAGVTGQGPLRGALMLGTAGNLLFPGLKGYGLKGHGLPDDRLLHTLHLTGVPLPFGGVLAGGNLNWFAGLLESDDPALFSRLDGEATQIPPGSEGLVFLPYLMGERTPIWDPGARGAFVGLSSRHRRAHLYRAILEGIAFAFRQIAEIVEGDQRQESSLQSITAIDGGSRSALWRQIFANVLNQPIYQGSERSGTALGSAFLAALGTGGVKSYEEIANWVEIASVTKPDPEIARRYREIYQVYKDLYPQLKTNFAVLNNFID